MARFHELRVNAIDRETPEAVSVGFEIPNRLKNEFKFIAGQYLTLEKEIAGKKFRRSYSICTSPKSDELKVTVKEIVNGRFSAWVNNKLKVGDTMNVFLPEGRFTFESFFPEQPKIYGAFAAGSGITPVMAILRNILETEPNSRFVLVYGNKTPEQTIFYKELIELKLKYSGRLFINFVYSQVEKETSIIGMLKHKFISKKTTKQKAEERPLYGRINKKTVEYIIKDKFKREHFETFYLCGPEAMTEQVTDVLQRNNIAEEKIKFELFGTDADATEEIKEGVSGETEVTIILDDEEFVFNMDRKTAVLDAVMEQDLDPPFSCQGGTCSSCMGVVIEGDVAMASNKILTDGEIEEGLILTCQSHPTSPKLVIDYDDV